MKEFKASEMLDVCGDPRQMLFDAIRTMRMRLRVSPQDFERATFTPDISSIQSGKVKPTCDVVLSLMSLVGVDMGVIPLCDLTPEHRKFWSSKMEDLGAGPLASSTGQVDDAEDARIQMFVRYEAVREMFGE